MGISSHCYSHNKLSKQNTSSSWTSVYSIPLSPWTSVYSILFIPVDFSLFYPFIPVDFSLFYPLYPRGLQSTAHLFSVG